MADPKAPGILAKVLVNYVSWSKVSGAVDSVLPAEIAGDARRNYIAHLAPNDLNDIPRLYRAVVDDMLAHDRLDRFLLALFEQGQANPVLREILQRRVTVDDSGRVPESALHSIRNTTEPFLNSQSFFPGMEAARFRVCAVWVDNPVNGKKQILGTGFLVAPDLVITAHHVVESLLGDGPAQTVDGEIVTTDVSIPGSRDRLAFVFDYWTQASNFDPDHPPPGVTIVRPAEDWLEWSSRTHHDDGITHLFGDPPAEKNLDCAVIRLSKKVGMAVAGRGGTRIRGWLRLQPSEPNLDTGSAIAILQHPSGGAQVFDKGNYKAHDTTTTRVFYETEAARGSSGSPCFDSAPAVVAFHNAGRPTDYNGDTAKCNQGVRIDHVVAEMPSRLVAESGTTWSKDIALWSLSDDPAKPEPVLGREDFKQAVIDLFDPKSRLRVITVEEAAAVAGVGASGKSFSTRILNAIARGRSGQVVEFGANEVRGMSPERFLAELGSRIGLSGLDSFPDKPTDERQLSRWWASDLPQWFGQLLEDRAKAAGTAALETSPGLANASALGRDLVLREIVWIVIDDIDRYPPEGGIKELLAGLMAITDTATLVGAGLKSLRWLIIGHIPDFIRERTTEYLRDEVSQAKVGRDEWVQCLATAFFSLGKQDAFEAKTAGGLYDFSHLTMADIQNPRLALKALSTAAAQALAVLLQSAGGHP